MPNFPSLHRLSLILQWIKQDTVISFEDVQRRYQKEMEPRVQDGMAVNDEYNIRTFQRDLNVLREMFGIDIEYDSKSKGYRRIEGLLRSKNLETMLDTLDLYKMMQMKPITEAVVFPDERRADGSEHMHLLLHAITNQFKMEFTYQKFDGDPPFRRLTNPIALKEFRNRWYLLAFQDGDPIVKTYCLDRISELKLSERKFNPADAENWRPKFHCVFGITSGNPDDVEDIVLSFDPQQGRYVKALKLHPNQEVVFENEKEIRIGLRLCITYDFIMEILSFGSRVRVLEPQSLIEELVQNHDLALVFYK